MYLSSALFFAAFYIIIVTLITFYIFRPQDRDGLTTEQKIIYKKQFVSSTISAVIGLLIMYFNLRFGFVIIMAGGALISILNFNSGIAIFNFDIIKGKIAMLFHIVYFITYLAFIIFVLFIYK